MKDQQTKQLLLQGHLEHGLYKLQTPVPSSSNAISSFSSSPSLHGPLVQAFLTQNNQAVLWHNRLGYLAPRVVNLVLKSFKLDYSLSDHVYSACQMAKSHRLPFVLSDSRAMKPFDLVHSDLWGPSPISSITSVKYFLLFIDDYTRFTWLYLLNNKSETFSYFLKFQQLIQTQFGTTIKALPLKPFLLNLGIVHRHPCPYTPEQNGRVERKNRDVVEKGLAMLAFASIPLSFWPYAFQSAVYLINWLPTPILFGKTPFESLYHTSP